MCYISRETIERAYDRMRNGVKSSRVTSVRHTDGFTLRLHCKSGNVISHRYTYEAVNEAFGKAWLKYAKEV